MSYECTVSFKKIQPSKVFRFFRTMKEEIRKPEVIDQLSSELYYGNPVSQMSISEIDKHIEKYADVLDFYNNRDNDPLLQEYLEWVRNKFKFRWFYLDEPGLLGMFGIPKTLRYLFDNTTLFQSYSDQDYDWDTWNGIDEFEKIANECRQMSDEELMRVTDYYIENNMEYSKKSYCYSRIYDKFVAPVFEDDDLPIYISLIDGISSAKERIQLFKRTYRTWREWYMKEMYWCRKKAPERKKV